MSKNTVKPALTRKRPKRVRENDEYAVFTRRILAATHAGSPMVTSRPCPRWRNSRPMWTQLCGRR
jgi:hypothetical protein